jgi:hypothetical protein
MTRVLLIEPDARLREIKEAQLRATGHLVLGVAEADLACAALSVSPYPLLVIGPDDALPLFASARHPRAESDSMTAMQ